MPNGKKSKYYYSSYTDHNGKQVKRSTKTSDKQDAKRIANKWQDEQQLIKSGVVDLQQKRVSDQSKRSLSAHIEEFEFALRSLKRSDQYITELITRIRKVCKACKFLTPIDISSDEISKYISFLKQEGKSARTMAKHISCMKYITKWMTEGGKLRRDPMSAMKQPNSESDRRLQRRVLLKEEFEFIKKNITKLKTRYRMEPEERLLLYETAIQTGFRLGELSKLTIGSFDQINFHHVLVLSGTHTKNNENANQYISKDLFVRLSALRRRDLAGNLLFHMPSKSNVSKMLAADLAELREQWIKQAKSEKEVRARKLNDFLSKINLRGEVLDFHALRHTCGAWLALAGEHPKVIQSVMRHSCITLTMNRYGHLFPLQEAEAVTKLWDNLNNPK